MRRIAVFLLLVTALSAAACGGAQAAPKPGVIWAVGDGADGSAGAKALAGRIRRDRPDRFLYLGDVYPAGTAEDFRDSYATVYGPLARITSSTPGNHEWGNRSEGYNAYWRARTGRTPKPWYTFLLGGWRLFSLNSEAPHDAGSDQLSWLKRKLRGAQGSCRLAFWHRPRASAGLHGDAVDIAPLWNALQGRARIVLSGHDHDSQRFRPSRGLVQYVAGAGGHGLYPVDRGDRRLRFADDTHYAALRIRLAPGIARLAFVSADGQVLDRSRVRCSGG